jgi:predicted DNA-binding antitoxin AbrB/MazE fold protein
MYQKIKAKYHKGVFIPKESFDFPENSEVEIIVESSLILYPEVSNIQERAKILKNLTERMKKNSIPTGTIRLTREELHERH